MDMGYTLFQILCSLYWRELTHTTVTKWSLQPKKVQSKIISVRYEFTEGNKDGLSAAKDMKIG